MLRWRLLSAIPLIGVLVGLMLLDVAYARGMIFAAVILAVAALAAIELDGLLRAGGMGLISGRKAFQRPMPDGVKLLHTIQDVYLDDTITIA